MKTPTEQHSELPEGMDLNEVNEILNRPVLYNSLMALRLEVDQSIVDHLAKVISQELQKATQQAREERDNKIISIALNMRDYNSISAQAAGYKVGAKATGGYVQGYCHAINELIEAITGKPIESLSQGESKE